MAVWGAPVAAGHEELKAVMAALAMLRETRVDPIRGTFDEAGELLRIRVGVASGEVLAGNMGCQARMNYTVIGDDVNLAARLESLCRNFGVSLLVSEAAYGASASFVVGRRLQRVAVVGKETAVAVYNVIGLKCSPDPEHVATLKEALAYSYSASDVMSNFSDPSMATPRGSVLNASVRRHEDRQQHRTAADMLAKLAALSDPSVALPAAVERHCDLFNEASILLDERHPAAALESLAAAEAACSVDDLTAVLGTGDHALDAIRERCETALRDPDSFVAVLNLMTKA